MSDAKMEWRPLREFTPDGQDVLLTGPGWDGFCVREWHSQAAMNDNLANWIEPPTHWMRPPPLSSPNETPGESSSGRPKTSDEGDKL